MPEELCQHLAQAVIKTNVGTQAKVKRERDESLSLLHICLALFFKISYIFGDKKIGSKDTKIESEFSFECIFKSGLQVIFFQNPNAFYFDQTAP